MGFNQQHGKQVKDESITGADIKDGSVDSADIKDGSVASVDLTAGAVLSTHLSMDALAAIRAYLVTTMAHVKASMTAAQNINANTWTKAVFNSEQQDTQSEYDTTNRRYTAKAARNLIVTTCIAWGSETNATSQQVAIYVNGTRRDITFKDIVGGRQNTGYAVSSIAVDHVTLAANDYLEIYVFSSAAATISNTESYLRIDETL